MFGKFSRSDASDVANLGRMWDENMASISRVNILVIGETGVGKSTLINAVFGADFAPTGTGRPVTEGVHQYQSADGTFALYDSQGFEIGAKDSPLDWLRGHFSGNRAADPADIIHAAWYCVSAYSARMTDGQAAVIKELSSLGIPVILVMTQVPKVNGVVISRALAFQQALLDMRLPTADGQVHLTCALADPERDEEQFGLQEVVEATSFRIPADQQTAFVAAQRVDLAAKNRKARTLTAAASAAAAGIGAAPLPLADAPALAAIQLGLMVKISHIFGVSKQDTQKIAFGTGGITTLVGRQLVAGLARLIPGAGNVLTAAVASTLTGAVGESWRAVCYKVATGQVDLRSAAGIAEAATTFRDVFGTRVRLPNASKSGSSK
ncbi:GTPase [Rarobacter incanus]|uniref:Uncharacterized protein (DUF697 family) n=1 Tax=Rarobacter incanus TaxID=153494 RepID=A0A542SMF5_9MICO|nr:GTPase domain-containing protein [Rarobacter incanus]TQK75814.1 uncharacterized protein (DUF697 family) [Rarobacter incanus]